MSVRALPVWVLATSLAGGSRALALDHPVDDAKQRLVIKRSPNGVETLLFAARDPSLLFPAVASADDPATGTPGGAVVELFSTAFPAGATLVAPAGSGVPGWSRRLRVAASFKFANDAAPDAFSDVDRIVLRQGASLRVLARRTGLALGAPQGAVGIRITTGSLRNCALFEGPAVLRDEAEAFVARGASAATLADCSAASLGGTPEVCGDGIVNQPSEQCDGTDGVSGCFPDGSSCGPPGFSTACRCCTYGGEAFSSFLPCCNPSSIVIGVQVSAVYCIPTRCDPPFTCSSPDQCQPDGTCCAGPGGLCVFTLIGPYELNPCCPGLECFDFWTNPYGITCCVPGGGACTSDADCCVPPCDAAGTCGGCRPAGAACTGDLDCCAAHCGASGTCDPCRAGGAPCTIAFECCSLSCNASGTCDACGPGGTPCRLGHDETCCSGSCNPSTFACDP